MRFKLLSLAVPVGSTLRLAPTFQTNSSDERSDRLVGVHVIFRHGARTPIFSIPFDPAVMTEVSWENEMTDDVPHTLIPHRLCSTNGQEHDQSFEEFFKSSVTRKLPGGAHSGQLTRLGQDEMFRFGQRLHQRYCKQLGFISSVFDPQQVYCRSTRYRRTVRSLRCVLAGMFDWTNRTEPARIHISNASEEILAPNRHNCRLIENIVRDYSLKDVPPGILAVREKVSQLLGPSSLQFKKKLKNGSVRIIPTRLYAVADYFYCCKYHNVRVPDAVMDLMNEIDAISCEEHCITTMGQESIRSVGLKAAIGLFVQHIIENLCEQAASQASQQRFLLYSTHDGALICLLKAFEICDGGWPPFAADLVIELYEKKDGGHEIQLRYCDQLLAKMPLSSFLQRLEAVSATSEVYAKICRR